MMCEIHSQFPLSAMGLHASTCSAPADSLSLVPSVQLADGLLVELGLSLALARQAHSVGDDELQYHIHMHVSLQTNGGWPP